MYIYEKKDKKILLFIIATIFTSFGIGYNLLKGTKAIPDTPLNEAFDDINFYKCVVDEDNKLIKEQNIGNTVDSILKKVDTNGSVDVLDITNIIKTGYKFRVSFPKQTLIYSISVMGDVNGDGIINRDDIVLSSKHLVNGNLITGIEYLKSLDIDDNNKTDINDIIKMVKKVK